MAPLTGSLISSAVRGRIVDDAEAGRILMTTAGACAVVGFLLPSFWGATATCALSAAWLQRRDAGTAVSPS